MNNIINNLPTLEGSEKQIAWAADIRAKMLRQTAATNVMAYIENHFGREITEEAVMGYINKHGEFTAEAIEACTAKVFAANTAASWWIDHRLKGDLCKEVTAAIFA